MYRLLSVASTIVIVAASLLCFSGTAYAHETRTVGAYQLQVGWLDEPALVGQLNSLELRVTDTRTNKPVTGLEKTLTADVSAGGLAPFKLELSATDEDGVYNGWVIPTVTGAYTFHLVGKIGTQTTDEKFSSGPNTFGDVEDITALQYPVKVPVADDLAKQLSAAKDAADQSRGLAVAGVAIGIIGLVVATIALRGGKRSV